MFIDRRPRGRCRLLRTRARTVHFRDVRRPRPVGSSPGSLRVPFVCSLLACWPCGRPCCSFRRGIRPWASKPYARLRRSVLVTATLYGGNFIQRPIIRYGRRLGCGSQLAVGRLWSRCVNGNRAGMTASHAAIAVRLERGSIRPVLKHGPRSLARTRVEGGTLTPQA